MGRKGAIFGLMGLLIAFTFAGAASRFDSRRQLVVEETNAIGTAYLRIDVLPAGATGPPPQAFRRYVDARLEMYRKLPDIQAAKEELARAMALQGEIWTRAVTACRAEANPPATMLVLPALNRMIDITTTQTMASPNAPANNHLRDAHRAGAGQFVVGRLRHGWGQNTELDST